MYRSLEKEEEICCLMYIFTSSTKHEILIFYNNINIFIIIFRHVIIIFQLLGAVMAKKCTKMCNTCAKLLFCQSKPIAFMPFLLTSPLSLLKLPIVLCTQLLIRHRGLYVFYLEADHHFCVVIYVMQRSSCLNVGQSRYLLLQLFKDPK